MAHPTNKKISVLLAHFKLDDNCKSIERDLDQVHAAIQKFSANILDQPLLALFAVWLKKYAASIPAVFDAGIALLDKNFIKLTDNKKAIWTAEKANASEHGNVYTVIRTCESLTIKRKEELLSVYTAFIKWLHVTTNGLVHELEDPDKLMSANRQLPFDRFIDFLDALSNPKSQLIAKLLYFGDWNLEKVLSLEIPDIDFHAQSISSTNVHFPEHVFSDIKKEIGTRKKGLLFLGRNDAPFSDATVFRHFNEAAQKTGLGASFGPKKLTATI